MGNCCSSGAVQITTSNTTSVATTTGKPMQDPTGSRPTTVQENRTVETAKKALDTLNNGPTESGASTPRSSGSESESEGGNDSRNVEEITADLTKQVGTTPELGSGRGSRSQSRLTAENVANVAALQKSLLDRTEEK